VVETVERIAVLLLAYGGPASLEEVPRFLRSIMAPREPSDEVVARATERYRAIGGRSPLVDNTLLQARLLQERLDGVAFADRVSGAPVSFHVVPGMRHTEPDFSQALRVAVDQCHARMVAVIMASHQSERATGAYHRDLTAAYDDLPAGIRARVAPPVAVQPWHTSEAFLNAVAGRVIKALSTLADGDPPSDIPILFTAHSLPLVEGKGDPVYEEALLATARGVMALVGQRPWTLAYQSASAARGGQWSGPAIEEVLREAAEAGTRDVVVAPLGFVSEHLETLYDLDIELAAEARRLGVRMARAGTVHDSPMFIETLAAAVAEGVAVVPTPVGSSASEEVG
jgi:ferrochelatase